MANPVLRFENTYDCPCGCHWLDQWDSMCDDRCPVCDTSCSPTSSRELSSVVVIDSLSMMSMKLLEEIYAAYGISQKDVTRDAMGGTLTGRMTSRVPNFWDVESKKVSLGARGHAKNQMFHELYGKKATMSIIDDLGNWVIPREDIYEGIAFDPMDFLDCPEMLVSLRAALPDEPSWKRTRFVSEGPTPPDAATRAKLRAKRKGKKK